jgi:hypothetical protein
VILGVENLRGTDSTSSFSGDETRFDVLKQGTPSHLYLPRAYAGAIAASGAQPGDEIQVLKTGVNGQTPTYRVRLISDATLEVPVVPSSQAQPDRFDQNVQQQQPNGIRMLAPRQQVAPQTQPTAQEEMPSFRAMQYSQLLLSVIDVAIGAEAYAAKKGRTILFNEEDIRAMTATLFINAQGGN